ncbi:MAG TPA: class I SAM-dependent rRNA methyltransferase [Flavobacteriaceae bacterium]|nr:class I SAM-dependent rRNA methyltransferase [Flavobacteriaceae bacterium]
MHQPKTLAVKLRPAAEKAVKQSHPWVFSKGIAKIKKNGNPGDLCIIFDRDTNKAMAIGLYDPSSPIRIKIIHYPGSAKIDDNFFKRKIQTAFAVRKPLLQTNTNAYRFLYGENDGFPGLIVDIYNKVGVVKLYSAIWFPYLQGIVEALVEFSRVEAMVLRLSRNLQKENPPLQEGAVLYGELKSTEVQFKEYGINFQIDVLLGHKTGFFLDHRENRRRIGQMAKDKTVLDVFAYAGGFSIHALAGEAKEVYSLDFSKQALQLAKKNAKLNPHKGKYKTMNGDAFEILPELIAQNKQYDIVVIDPPSFAKRKREIVIAKKKYAELAALGAKLTAKGGLLLLASCSSRINADVFVNIHKDEFRKTGVNYELKDFTQHDIDHPIGFKEGAYLKSAYYRIY